MRREDPLNVMGFLRLYPGMSLVPTGRSLENAVLKGLFRFYPEGEGATGEKACEFYIGIACQGCPPDPYPLIWELGEKIPKDLDHHVFLERENLCLGSPVRLRHLFYEKGLLAGFVKACLAPYLHAMAIHLREGGKFIYGELAHGPLGLLHDYKDLFQVQTEVQVLQVLRILGLPEEQALQEWCPCGCGKRVGECNFQERLRPFKRIAEREWYWEQYRYCTPNIAMGIGDG